IRNYLQHPSEPARAAAEARLRMLVKTTNQMAELWNAEGTRVLVLPQSAAESAAHQGRAPRTTGVSEFTAAHGAIYYQAGAAVCDAAGPDARMGSVVAIRSFSPTSSIDVISRLIGAGAAMAIGADGGVWTDLSKVVAKPPVSHQRGTGEYTTAAG